MSIHACVMGDNGNHLTLSQSWCMLLLCVGVQHLAVYNLWTILYWIHPSLLPKRLMKCIIGECKHQRVSTNTTHKVSVHLICGKGSVRNTVSQLYWYSPSRNVLGLMRYFLVE